MTRSTKIQNELADLAPAQAELPVQQPFELPKDYFSNFTGVLLQKIEEENKVHKTVPVVRLSIGKIILRYAIAASITGLLGFGLYILYSPTPQIQTTTLGKQEYKIELSEESVAQYFAGIDDWTSEEEYAETLADNNLLVDIDIESISTLLSGMTAQEINQYLDQQGYDQSTTNFF